MRFHWSQRTMIRKQRSDYLYPLKFVPYSLLLSRNKLHYVQTVYPHLTKTRVSTSRIAAHSTGYWIRQRKRIIPVQWTRESFRDLFPLPSLNVILRDRSWWILVVFKKKTSPVDLYICSLWSIGQTLCVVTNLVYSWLLILKQFINHFSWDLLGAAIVGDRFLRID